MLLLLHPDAENIRNPINAMQYACARGTLCKQNNTVAEFELVLLCRRAYNFVAVGSVGWASSANTNLVRYSFSSSTVCLFIQYTHTPTKHRMTPTDASNAFPPHVFILAAAASSSSSRMCTIYIILVCVHLMCEYCTVGVCSLSHMSLHNVIGFDWRRYRRSRRRPPKSYANMNIGVSNAKCSSMHVPHRSCTCEHVWAALLLMFWFTLVNQTLHREEAELNMRSSYICQLFESVWVGDDDDDDYKCNRYVVMVANVEIRLVPFMRSCWHW